MNQMHDQQPALVEGQHVSPHGEWVDLDVEQAVAAGAVITTAARTSDLPEHVVLTADPPLPQIGPLPPIAGTDWVCDRCGDAVAPVADAAWPFERGQWAHTDYVPGAGDCPNTAVQGVPEWTYTEPYTVCQHGQHGPRVAACDNDPIEGEAYCGAHIE